MDYIQSTVTAPREKSKIVCFASPRMKKIVIFPARPRLPVTLIRCVAFRSVSNAICLLKSFTIHYQYSLNYILSNKNPVVTISFTSISFCNVFMLCYVTVNQLNKKVSPIIHKIWIFIFTFGKNCLVCLGVDKLTSKYNAKSLLNIWKVVPIK